MPATMDEIFTSLNELEMLVEKTTDPLEQEGLKAFINCITPQLMSDVSFSLLGKIAQTTGQPLGVVKASSQDELFEAIGKDYEIIIE